MTATLTKNYSERAPLSRWLPRPISSILTLTLLIFSRYKATEHEFDPKP
jgi:hypothetical protein